MTQPSDQPIGIPGAQPDQGPSLAKPVFEAPVPPISTEHAGAAFVLAGWGRRFTAIIVDGIVRALIAGVIALAIVAVFTGDPFSIDTSDSSDISPLGGVGIVAFVLYYLVLPFLYGPTFMVRYQGATPGKRLLGIRVVTEAGPPPSFGAAVLREGIFKTVVVGWIGGTFFFPWLLNYLWPLWDEQSRGGHDFMARTRVVRAGT